MARVIQMSDNQLGYISLVATVMDEGDVVQSRIGETREVFGATLVLTDPFKALPIGIGRGTNKALAAVEAASLIGGVVRPELLCTVAPNFSQFMDNGEFHGAYGPRLKYQYPHVERRLRETPDTRQAVGVIWDSRRDLPVDGLHDYPCTLAHSFYIRNDKLMMHTTMRSQDCVWGVPYDLFMFTQVQLTMANVLGIEPGEYNHHSISLHIYERDYEKIEQLVDNWETDSHFLDALPTGFEGSSWTEAAQAAATLLEGRAPMTQSEKIYHSMIESKARLG